MMRSSSKRVTISQRSRPLRFGYLLRGLDDADGLRNGIQLYTSLWGGVYNGFVPVYDQPPSWWEWPQSGAEITQGYVDAFEPDFLVTEDRDLADGLGYEDSRVLLKSDLVRQDSDTPFSHGLGVHELFACMWKEDFQYVKREPPEIVVPHADTKAFEPLVATCFGEYPARKEGSPDFEGQFRHVFDAEDLSITGDRLLRLHLDGVGYPLNVGAAHLEVRPRGWRSEPLLYLLDSTSTLDLVDFWNLRALGVCPIPVPLPWFDELRRGLAHFVEESHRPHPHNADLMLGTTVMRGRSLDDEKARSVEEELSVDCTGGVSFQRWYPRIWQAFGRDRDHVLRAEVVSSRDETEVALTSGRITFRACPLPVQPRFAPHRRADSARVVRVREYGGGSGIAAVTPRNLEKAGDVIGSFPDELVWFSSEGIVTTCEGERQFFWKLPMGTDVCRVWLEQHGFSVEVTSGGKLMHRAVRRLGGLGYTRMLAREPLVQLLNRMAGLPDRPRRTYNTPKMIGKLKTITGSDAIARNLLHNLLDRKVLEVGVRLKCEQCGQKKNWYALDAIGRSVQCHRCLQEFPFPAADPPERPWYYRTIGAFAVEDYIQGALSVMLAMRLLMRIGAGPSWYRKTWCPSFKLRRGSDGYECEVDAMGFVAQSDPYRGAVLPVFVEGKSYGAEKGIFDEKDAEHMRRIGTHFPGAVLAFVTLRSELHPSDIQLIKPLADAGREPIHDGHWRNPVVVLTGLELFSEGEPPYCWKGVPGAEKMAGRGSMRGLFDLADATQRLHLKMPPRSE